MPARAGGVVGLEVVLGKMRGVDLHPERKVLISSGMVWGCIILSFGGRRV